ncbi:hypothetical protein BDZ89DRAFT_1128081 [Hymenopellis radicata]|nr:hypothetical protein BDZ89DRAFT_1128081 [Hymenopellis radicata]
MHPLVWRNMVFIAARYGFLRLTESPSPSYARLLSLLLPEGPEPVTPDIVLPTYWANPLNMPLKDVVNGKYLRPVMWNYFVLNIRGDYISDDGNSSCLTSEQKALLVLGNLAIRHTVPFRPFIFRHKAQFGSPAAGGPEKLPFWAMQP